MKRSTFIRLALGGAVGAGLPTMTPAISRGAPTADVVPRAKNRSLQLEVGRAIEKGLAYLKTKQDPAGHWGSPDYPALTALALVNFLNEPSGTYKAKPPEFITKALAYLVGCAKPDGGIYGKDLGNYNTALSILALYDADADKYADLIRKGRQYIIGQQTPKVDGKPDPFEGGVGYGSHGPHSDLSNTAFALEALRKTKPIAYAQDNSAAKDLDWEAAARFVERCQDLPAYNKEPWVTNDPKNLGGFVYSPVESKAEEDVGGKKAFRAYGSISYQGMLSYIYADLSKNDPRVTAVHEWLTRNYTLTENPGMGAAGLYYYYHAMAKGLTAFGADTLQLANGKSVDWREALSLKLIDLQASEGSWVNDKSGRWWEKDPVLVTAYSVHALEVIHPDI